MLLINSSKLEVSNIFILQLLPLPIAKALVKCLLLLPLFHILTNQSAKCLLYKPILKPQRLRLSSRKLLTLKLLRKKKEKQPLKRKQLKILLLEKNQRRLTKKIKRRRRMMNQQKLNSLTLLQFHSRNKKLITKKICLVNKLSSL